MISSNSEAHAFDPSSAAGPATPLRTVDRVGPVLAFVVFALIAGHVLLAYMLGFDFSRLWFSLPEPWPPVVKYLACSAVVYWFKPDVLRLICTRFLAFDEVDVWRLRWWTDNVQLLLSVGGAWLIIFGSGVSLSKDASDGSLAAGSVFLMFSLVWTNLSYNEMYPSKSSTTTLPSPQQVEACPEGSRSKAD